MTTEWDFGRKLNLAPLLKGILISLVIGIALLVFGSTVLALTLGLLAFCVTVFYVYPNTLERTYGYWKVDQSGIYYYDYRKWFTKVIAVLLPLNFALTKINFDDVTDLKIVQGTHVLNSSDVLGSAYYAPEVIFTSMRTKCCLRIFLKDGTKVDLDLSYNVSPKNRDKKYVEQMVKFISTQIEVN